MQSTENKTWSTLSHAGTFSKYFFPFGNFLIPLGILMIKKPESFIEDHSKQALNFQLNIFLYYAIWIGVSLFVALILGLNFGTINEFYFSEGNLTISNTKDFAITPYLIFIAIVAIVGIGIFILDTFAVIQASISASEGKKFKYPLTIPILKKESFIKSSSKNEQFNTTQNESL